MNAKSGDDSTLSISFKDTRYYPKKDDITNGNVKMILAKKNYDRLDYIAD